ncbi:hypothetical protein C1Y63_04715 [Corynebacterium sp. 13CS0277]|uniref:phage antirepressor KilAC domain-containing protein n=1 Tax=Corynebacterium sp. 13CS0277 TaxID=2071994 RepID=UPI000D02C6D8|nr:phage antirepressor KilAC domain-containing protein [Corynebacterium sp. 13CS0277]PRQ11714.1 hypothetical protein C1Y63_04715 [Corynebacterium sp. 13CS0277]
MSSNMQKTLHLESGVAAPEVKGLNQNKAVEAPRESHAISDVASEANVSPFDDHRHVREDGTEYWSARDLMTLMGYPRWGDFQKPLTRAMKAAENQNAQLEGNFRRSPKVSGKRGPAQEDYELSRFAAYLVAMNGDPNKLEVAAAQAYFAIRTRQAETGQAPTNDDSTGTGQWAIPTTYAQALQVAAQQAALAEDLKSENEQLLAEIASNEAQVVELACDLWTERLNNKAAREFMDADGLIGLRTVAKILRVPQQTFYRLLREDGILITGGQLHNTPYAKYERYFQVKTRMFDKADGTIGISHTTYLLPSSVPWITMIRDDWTKKGLIK